jgi:hypothetical protein
MAQMHQQALEGERRFAAEQEQRFEELNNVLKELRSTQPPAQNRVAVDWEGMSAGAVWTARSRDMQCLREFLTQKEWRSCDVATALNDVGMLPTIFDTREVYDLRFAWLTEVFDFIAKDTWDARLVSVTLEV